MCLKAGLLVVAAVASKLVCEPAFLKFYFIRFYPLTLNEKSETTAAVAPFATYDRSLRRIPLFLFRE